MDGLSITSAVVNNLKNSIDIRSIKKYSPEILTSVGIGCMLGATIYSVRQTPKAILLLNNRLEENGHEETVVDSFKNKYSISYLNYMELPEIIQTTWKLYIPAAIYGGVGIACLFGANSIHNKRTAAVTTAYTLTESAYRAYRNKNLELIGNNKEEKVRNEIAKEIVEKNPVVNNEVVITEKGDTLCYDSVSGRYFKSDIDVIKKAVNEVNRRLIDEMYISLNDFYYELGLDGTQIGYQLGWNVNNGLLEIDFSTQLSSDGRPCLVISYLAIPRYDYFS